MVSCLRASWSSSGAVRPGPSCPLHVRGSLKWHGCKAGYGWHKIGVGTRSMRSIAPQGHRSNHPGTRVSASRCFRAPAGRCRGGQESGPSAARATLPSPRIQHRPFCSPGLRGTPPNLALLEHPALIRSRSRLTVTASRQGRATPRAEISAAGQVTDTAGFQRSSQPSPKQEAKTRAVLAAKGHGSAREIQRRIIRLKCA